MSSASGLDRMQQKCSTTASDWQSKDFRWKFFNTILNNFKKQLPEDDVKKLKMIATNFEDKCFSTSSCQEEYVSKIQRKLNDMENLRKSAAVDGNKNNSSPVHELTGPIVIKKEEVEEKPSVNLSIEQQLQKQHQPPNSAVHHHPLNPKFPKVQVFDIVQANAMQNHSKLIRKPLQSQANKQVIQHQHVTSATQHQSKLLQGHRNILKDVKQPNQRHQQSLQCQPHEAKSESNQNPYVQSSPKPLMHPQRQSQPSNLQMQRNSNLLQNGIQTQKQPTPTKRDYLDASSSEVVLSTGNATVLGADEQEEAYQKIQSLKKYLPELRECYFRMVRLLQQMASSLTPELHSKYESHKHMMNILSNITNCLSLSKDKIKPGLKEILPGFEAKIHKIIAHLGKINDKPNQNISSTVQGESTSMGSNINLIQANQHPVEKLNKSKISSSRFSKNLSPQKDQLNAETPTSITASSAVENGSNNSNGQTTSHTQSSVVFKPGMYPSPLLDEFSESETIQNNAVEAHVDELSTKAPPMDKLTELIKSLSSETLSSAVTDIRGVVSLTDRMHSCNPHYMVAENKVGSRCEIREDLSLLARCHVQSENVTPQYMGTKNKINCDITASSHVNDGYGLRNYALYTSQEKMIVSSNAKRQKTEINRLLQEEISKINQKLFNTKVEIEENVADYDNVKLSAVGEGTLIKCSFTPVTYSSDMKSLLSSSECQIMPLSLQIPSSYPDSSPILLNQLPDAELHKDNLNGKIHSRIERSMRCIPHPMSLEEIVRAWNSIVQDVIIESLGGCTFTSYYGSWQNILSV